MRTRKAGLFATIIPQVAAGVVDHAARGVPICRADRGGSELNRRL